MRKTSAHSPDDVIKFYYILNRFNYFNTTFFLVQLIHHFLRQKDYLLQKSPHDVGSQGVE